MNGIITKVISNDFTVETQNNVISCKARGKFRNEKITPVVGDKVIIDENKKIIEKILPRKNSLKRPVVANIDQAIIITSVKSPELDLYLLDKLLCIIEYNNILPIICFTKLDLLENKEEIDKIRAYYHKIGYQVFYSNELEEIKKIFKNKISVFTGQSGAGKSTLLNKLDIDLNLNTAEISKALGRGKHTTRHVELIDIYDGKCADTPGFSSLEFTDMKKEYIRDNMIEFNTYRHECKYKDCMHDKDDDCRIKELINKEILESRYENYLKFIKDDKR